MAASTGGGPDPPTGKLALIGAGKMATALAAGFVRAGLIRPEAITASDPSPEAQDAFAEAVPGARVVGANTQAAGDADVLLLAVKPHLVSEALGPVAGALPSGALVISVAAGVTLATLAECLPPGARLIRVMPNTPCLIGHGASGFSPGPYATEADTALVERLLSAVGVAFRMPEPLLNAATGLSGSGPAFIYTAIEALADAGVREGLPRPVATQLAAHTVAGAAAMVTQTGQHPALLREAVTSPGGTTAAGLATLDRCGLRHALGQAVSDAARRSRELGGPDTIGQPGRDAPR